MNEHPLAKAKRERDGIPDPKEAALSALRSVSLVIAERYGMEAQAFEQVVFETCAKGLSLAEFAAFLMVAKEYKLNPITREIFAFPKKGGGIVPVVSVDGWISLVNSHPEMDGMEFVENNDEKGQLVSTTCRLYRKDRSKPVEVTEYLEECKRDTDPWKMQHRMLRHKSMIQCARYAFGFSGIYDEEEGAVIAAAIDVTPAPTPKAPPPEKTAEIKADPQPAVAKEKTAELRGEVLENSAKQGDPQAAYPEMPENLRRKKGEPRRKDAKPYAEGGGAWARNLEAEAEPEDAEEIPDGTVIGPAGMTEAELLAALDEMEIKAP